ncbi:MAG: SIS domain-containing protein [Chloroflexi bacterium]|nr:SIS domain-containing protein [Chloroflexota bacterium]MBI4504833.1 SIS domain-containing protein [Chloroflexota bacterium]
MSAAAVIDSYFAHLAEVLRLVPREPICQALDVLRAARAAGRRVYVIGNGGSAATASHLVADLTKTARLPNGPALRCFALADNTPLLTALANDTAYERVFAEQVAALVEPGDVVIAISGSGSSANIVAGLRAAADRGAHTIGLLGFDGGAARHLVDVLIHVPCNHYGLVEDAHMAIGHALTAALRGLPLPEIGAPGDGAAVAAASVGDT